MFDVVGDILAEPWFWPAVSVIVGLPLVLLVLGEVHTAMVRRGTPGAHIVLLVRNVLAPLGAIIILFTQIPQEAGNADFTWPKVAATAFGFVLIAFSALILLGLQFWRGLDDMHKQGHAYSWYWGSIGGLAVTACIITASGLARSEFTLGVATLMVMQLVCSMILYAFWWFKGRGFSFRSGE